MPTSLRNLVLVLGDQLDRRSSAFDGFDAAKDAVLMVEASGEATHVWCSKPRLVYFLSAMRHFRDSLRREGLTVHYAELDASGDPSTLEGRLSDALKRLKPARVRCVHAGEHRVLQNLDTVARDSGVPLEWTEDRHFLCSTEEFSRHAQGRRQLRMEFFYREMRQRHRILLTPEGEPEGGRWNFDEENRGAFSKEGPQTKKTPLLFPPDKITREVIELVERRFPKHPGSLHDFNWPVSSENAEAAWKDFLEHRLREFGTYQDAMWTGEPWLFHARISCAMNVKLLAPLRMVRDVDAAYREGRVPLASAEGFIRQILGWREYVRGVYWLHMPGYLERNALAAQEPLPEFFWTGETDMACLRETISQTLRFGYAHHIQRLMVTGLYTLMLGVDPKAVHEWYLSVYVDAVEWVELPNTLGMSQYADGGVMASKPYVATGKYLKRMSNYCAGCRFDPEKATGPDACPFTTLYWDFLLRHEKALRLNQRMALQVRNVDRLNPAQRREIQEQASDLRENGGQPRTFGRLR